MDHPTHTSTTGIFIPGSGEELEDGMIPLTHFPLPDTFLKAEQAVREGHFGPHPYATVETCYEWLYSDHMAGWKGNVGQGLYYMALGYLTPRFVRDIKDIQEENSSATRELVPLMTSFIDALFQIVVKQNDPTLILVAVTAFKEYILAIEDDQELNFLVEPLIEHVVELDRCKGQLTKEQRKAWLQAFTAAVSVHAIPLPTIILTQQEFGKDLSEDVEQLTVVDKGSSFEIKIPAELPPPTVHATSALEQMDGSMAPSAQEELRAIFRPRREILSSIEAQLADTLSLHERPYKEALELWWKLHRSKGDNKCLHIEARMLDSVGRLLTSMVPPDVIGFLVNHLPMDEVVQQLVRFISGNEREVPSMTWPQVRISLLSMPIGRMAYLGSKPLIEHAVDLYKSLGWDEDIPLLIRSLEVHAETMDIAIKRSMAEPRLNTKQ